MIMLACKNEDRLNKFSCPFSIIDCEQVRMQECLLKAMVALVIGAIVGLF